MTKPIREVDGHPVPFDQEEINELWEEDEYFYPEDSDPPHVDEAHERYTHTITRRGDWTVFRSTWPFTSPGVYFFHGGSGDCYRFRDDEGAWHAMVNLFADIVDEEGDCRDAEYSDSLMPSSSIKQSCKNCGASWSI